MLKYLKATLLTAALTAAASPAFSADPAEGEKVFHKCSACHSIGPGAKSRVGPELNELIGRTPGTVHGFNYSAAMVAFGESGKSWDEQTLTQFLVKPKDLVKGTKMSFAGLRSSSDVANVIAYLKLYSGGASPAQPERTAEAPAEPKTDVAMAEKPAPAAEATAPDHKGMFGLGRIATTDEVSAWDMDVRPDGLGLPVGHGTVAQGEEIFTENCAMCHGDFGEGVGRWPVLAGGQDTLTDDRPEKTIGSYWPYLSTVYDYIRRAMPFGNARSLSDDEVYALTAYLLYLNDVVTDEDFELSNENFSDIHLPNEANFIEDDRFKEAHYAIKDPCMTDCKPAPVEITKRAQILDVTPEGDDENKGGGID